MTALGDKIKELRQKKGLTQLQLGQHIDAAESTISLYESGKREPDNSTLLRIADFFGVSTDYLLGRTDIKRPMETIAASRSDNRTDDLPEQALKEIEQFKEFVRSRYGKKPTT